MAPVIDCVVSIVIVRGLVDVSVVPHVVGIFFFKLQKNQRAQSVVVILCLYDKIIDSSLLDVEF